MWIQSNKLIVVLLVSIWIIFNVHSSGAMCISVTLGKLMFAFLLGVSSELAFWVIGFAYVLLL